MSIRRSSHRLFAVMGLLALSAPVLLGAAVTSNATTLPLAFLASAAVTGPNAKAHQRSRAKREHGGWVDAQASLGPAAVREGAGTVGGHSR